MPGHVTRTASASSDAKGNPSRTENGNRNGNLCTSGDYPWKYSRVDIEDEELIRQVNESCLAVADPLKHIDVKKNGLYVWHIKAGALVHWRREDYGQFYDKECFLVLHIQDLCHEDGQPVWTLHLWVGRCVSEVTFAQAVYSTVSLASGTLESKAVIHREAQGQETNIFRKYFNRIIYLKGSVDQSYWCMARAHGMHQSRLLKCCRLDPMSNQYTFIEVPSKESLLDTSFVYVLDLGKQVYQWNGDLCKTEDVLKAAQYVQHLKCCRGSDIKVEIINDQQEEDQRFQHPFYMFLSHKSYLDDRDEDETHSSWTIVSSRRSADTVAKGSLYRLTNEKGRLQFKRIKNGIITQKDVNKELSCLIDLGYLCVLWFSLKVVVPERAIGLVLAQEYLRESEHPIIPVVIVTEGQLSKEFHRALHK